MGLAAITTTALLLLVVGCTEPTEESVWALDAIGDTALPTSAGPAFASVVLADTLVFGVEDDRWRPRPLARSDRVISIADLITTESWFYTYDGPPSGQFAIRGLCADGDLASCVDATGTAEATETTLRIEFTQANVFGTLHYHRVR